MAGKPIDGDDEQTTGIVHVHERLANPMGAASLQVIRSPDRGIVGRVFPLGHEVLIGRSTDATIPVLDDGLSRQHIRVTKENNAYHLADLQSRNGTWVNGVRVAKVELKAGDQIEIGRDTVMRFSSGSTDLHLREALNAARVATWEWTPNVGLVTFSEMTDALLGLSYGTVGGVPRRLAELAHAEDLARVTSALEQALRDGAKVELEFRLGIEGPQRWINLKGDAVRDEWGARIAGTLMDSTARKEAESELRRHALIFHALHDPVFVTTLTGQVLDTNAAAEALFLLERATCTGRHVLELLRAPPKFVTGDIAQVVLGGNRWSAEIDVEAGNGKPISCEVTAVPVRKSPTDTVGLLWTFRDIRERRQLLRQLSMAERLAAMGTLSAGIAHEINNPLAFVIGNLSYLADELKDLEDEAPGFKSKGLLEVLTDTAEGARRIATIVQDLKAFARDDTATGEAAPVDVRRAVQVAHKMANHTLKHRADVRVQLDEVPPILGHEHRVAQVALNLMVNAGQAIPDEQAGRGVIEVHVFREGDSVCVSVKDSGTGIAPDVLPHIFDPFFTTKPVGIGTGLGLSIVHGLVNSMGGRIEVDSVPGKGTTFKVSFPMTTAQPRERSSESLLLAPARVLVIDDEPLVIASLARHLRGHQVTGASSSEEALALLGSREFDVVVCDLLMPGMSGIDLHAALQERAPAQAARFIFITGGTVTERVAAVVGATQLPVLRKPVDLENLRRAIAEVMSARPLAQA